MADSPSRNSRSHRWEPRFPFSGAPLALVAVVGVASPLEQVFPTGAPPSTASAAQVEAARGEWEPFQIVVAATDRALTEVRATASALVGPGGARLPPPLLARVAYVELRERSSIEGRSGAWPDPLIPDVDTFAHERRRAFPFAVPAGERRAIWVELWVPPSAPPGLYRGEVTVAAAGLPPTRVAVALTVHAFTLPRSSSLPVTFGITGPALPRAHHLPAEQQAALLSRYALSALRHRISLHGGSLDPAPWSARGGRLTVDWAPYDAEVGPFLDGTADPGGPADGARWTAVDLRLPARLDGAARDDYLRALVAHFRARGWLARLFDYTYDEPADAAWPELRARAERVHRVAPEVPRLVTKELTAALVGWVDIWCPVVNFVDDKPGNSSLPPRAAYDGRRLWWYQACMSHGCDLVGGDYFTGWPSYAIDAPAVAHRIFEWLTFRYRVGGELYFNTVRAYLDGDPWLDSRRHGGNGDGTLFYPGRPDVIGGTTHIPVESIRLALIREGLEDYEYLSLYAARFGRRAAEALAAQIAGRTFRWDHDGARLLAVRHRIAAALDEP
jgi:hypothetical protein